MSTCNPNKALLISLAVNIFLVAFLIGRETGMKPHPPHLPGIERPGEGAGPHGKGHFRRPPFLTPESVLTPEEMDAERPYAEEKFEKIRDMRSAFRHKLERNTPLNAEEVKQHFAEVDEVMQDLKAHMHEKIADKISAMPVAERKQLAERLKKQEDAPPPPRN